MSRFPKIFFIAIPAVLMLSLVYFSGGAIDTQVNALEMPEASIFGFGFWEEQIFLIAMLFLFFLMLVGSIVENRSNSSLTK